MRTIGQLDHPHLVAAHYAGEHQGRLFLVMELLQGIDLSQLLHRHGPLQSGDACELARQAAVALHYFHERGLVHRDIKPSNLMLTQSSGAGGQDSALLKILDLGLARLTANADERLELTGGGRTLGTADYMAPEQQRDAAQVGPAADLYSLGCTLFHLLVGQPPFSHHRSFLDKLIAHRQEAPPDARKCGLGLSEELNRILDRLLAKNAADRFPDADALAKALAPLATGARLEALFLNAAVSTSRSSQLAPAPVDAADSQSSHEDSTVTWAKSGSSSRTPVVAVPHTDLGATTAVPRPQAKQRVWRLAARFRIGNLGCALQASLALGAVLLVLGSGMFFVHFRSQSERLPQLAQALPPAPSQPDRPMPDFVPKQELGPLFELEKVPKSTGRALTPPYAAPKPPVFIPQPPMSTPPAPLSPQQPPVIKSYPPLEVRTFRVIHFANRGADSPEARGELGSQSYATQFGDSVQIKAKLSEPAYLYLVALNPDGKLQLCWPADKQTAPQRSDQLTYPEAGKAFTLDDEPRGGLQAFVVLASRQPLPEFAKWETKVADLGWRRVPASTGVVWHGDGKQLDPLVPGMGQQRGSVTELPGVGPLAEVVRRLRAGPNIDAAAVWAFAVEPKRGP
jgi:hypothetical protein